MANPTNLPLQPLAQLDQARADIPLDHYREPIHGGIVSHPDTAFIHVNDWAFLNGHAYVRVSGSAKARRVRYSCIFHSRKDGERTQNTRKLDEDDRLRVGTKVRGLNCPVGITISRFVHEIESTEEPIKFLLMLNVPCQVYRQVVQLPVLEVVKSYDILAISTIRDIIGVSKNRYALYHIFKILIRTICHYSQ